MALTPRTRQKLEGTGKRASELGVLGSPREQSWGLNLPEVAQEKGRKAAGGAMLRQGEDSGAGPGSELGMGLMSAAHLSWNF